MGWFSPVNTGKWYEKYNKPDVYNADPRSVRIQAQDSSGAWMGASTVPMSTPSAVRAEMESMKRQYPNSFIRAVDVETGALVGFLP